MTANKILTHSEIDHKIKRIAFQIYETFIEEESIVIAGIASNGYVFAEKIARVLQTIAPLEVILCEVKMNKQNPNSEISTSITKEVYQNKGIVLVDDVLNSGSTLMYGVKHFLEVPVKKFKAAKSSFFLLAFSSSNLFIFSYCSGVSSYYLDSLIIAKL